MERNNFSKIILLLLVTILFTGCSVNYAIRVNDGRKVSVDEMIAEVKGARVIIVGEIHDDPGHHQIQLDIIKELKSSGVPVAVGLEMFSFESQGALDAWIAGKIEVDRLKAPVKAGKELGVKVPCIVKDSDQLWPPSHASATREGAGEALTGVRTGPAIELRNHLVRVADLVV